MATTLPTREFDQDPSRATRAAADGPVFITDRGVTTHVLLTFVDYRRLVGSKKSIAELLSCPEAADIEFDPPKLHYVSKPAVFD